PPQRGISETSILPRVPLRIRDQRSTLLLRVRDVPVFSSQSKDRRLDSLDTAQIRLRRRIRNIPQPICSLCANWYLQCLFSVRCNPQQSGSGSRQLCTQQLSRV